jgi:hypothetical protein
VRGWGNRCPLRVGWVACVVTTAVDGASVTDRLFGVSDLRPDRQRVGAGAGAQGHGSGQLVVTLSGVILAVTHCGFGPAKPR